jgi:hypothetical protein
MFAKALLLALTLAIVVAISARTSDGAGPEQPYVVARYDTLWSIAASHYAGDPREAIWKIENRNHLAGSTIVPGQILRLP